MPIGKFLDPKNDYAFKRIFGTEKNKDILIHFLNDIFARTTNPIEEVTFLKSSQDPKLAAERQSIVDVLCQDMEGNRFIIEMQVGHEKGFEKRAQFYASRAYIDQRDSGVAYQDLQSVTFLAIMDFVLFPKKAEYVCHHQMLDIKTHERDLKDFSFSFIELPKFKAHSNQLQTLTQKWCYFFKSAQKTTEADLIDIIGPDIIIKKAYDELDRFSWSKEDLQIYEAVDMKLSADKAIFESAFERGEEKGRKEGELFGIEKEKKETSHKMFLKGMSIDIISEVTGLTQAKIKKLFNL